MLEYKDYCSTVEYSAVDNILHGKVLGIRGLISYEGDSLHSLKEDFEGAIADIFAFAHSGTHVLIIAKKKLIF